MYVLRLKLHSTYHQHIPGARRVGDERREATTRRVMSRAPGNLLLREARERSLELAQEGRVADVLEAEAPAPDRRAGTVEEHPRGEVPVYRSAGHRGHYGLPQGVRVSASNRRLRHDRAAFLAVRRKPVACDEGGDLVRRQLLVPELIAWP